MVFGKFTSKILLFLIPVFVFVLLYILISNIFFSKRMFMYRDEKLVGSRWFSYKFSDNRYFRIDEQSGSAYLISESSARYQVKQIEDSRGLSDVKTKLLINDIDSLANSSKYEIGSEKAIDVYDLNIKLDEIK